MSVSTADAALNCRIPIEAMDRAAALQAELSTEPAYAGVKLSRADVLRLAIFAGLDALERRRRAAGGEVGR